MKYPKGNELHILMMPSWYLPEGGQFCRNQAQALCESGVQCNVLANVPLAWKKYKWKTFTYPWMSYTSKEDNLIVFRKFTRRVPRFRVLNGLLYTLNSFIAFKKYKKKYGSPDLIHVHSVLWAGYAAYLIKKKYKIPYIITEHRGVFGLSCDYAYKSFVDSERNYMKKAFSNADIIVPVSDKLISHIKTFLTKEVPIYTISNIVDTSYFFYKDREPSKATKFVTTNDFSYVKGYDILIPAFDMLCEKVKNISLTIAGAGFNGIEFQQIWHSVKNKDKFFFTEELDVEGIRKVLWDADVFVLASRVESQSVSTLEALSTGLPVVGTEVIPEIILNDITGIRVPVENIEALYESMLIMTDGYLEYDGKEISDYVKSISGKDAFITKLVSTYKYILYS